MQSMNEKCWILAYVSIQSEMLRTQQMKYVEQQMTNRCKCVLNLFGKID